MNQEISDPPYHLSNFGWIWLATLIFFLTSSWIIGIFNNSTTLTPRHDGSLQIAFYIACFVAAFSTILIFLQSKGALYRRLVMSIIVTPIFAIAGVFLFIAEVATFEEARHDFPPGRTKTFDGLIVLQRAYQTHGKGRSWNVQTTPIWSDINITQSDYNFMLGHRAPNDEGDDPDEITSHGYFCARVTLQQSGDALRVMHAGNKKLPSGSVGICSQFLAKEPRLPVVG